MPDRSIQIAVGTSYLSVYSLISAKLTLDNLPQLPRKHFRTIEIFADPTASGNISLQRGDATSTNPYIVLQGGQIDSQKSGTRMNNESLEGLYIKSDVNLDKVNILLKE